MLPQSATEQIVNLSSSKSTYSVAIPDYVPVANATDLLQLIGAVGKLITVTMIRINSAATTATFENFYAYKRTAPNTGGTISNPAVAKHDSRDPAPSAVVNQYSANPSALGAGVLVRSEHVSASAAAAGNLVTEWIFGDRAAKALILNGPNESLCLNFGGNSVPAGTNVHMTIEWTEE